MKFLTMIIVTYMHNVMCDKLIITQKKNYYDNTASRVVVLPTDYTTDILQNCASERTTSWLWRLGVVS